MLNFASKTSAAFQATCFLVAYSVLPLTSIQAGELTAYRELIPNSNDFFELIDLLPGGEYPGIIVGDKIFSGFMYQFTGDMPTSDLINITGIQVDGHYGIRIQGGFKDLFDPGNQSSDALLNFDVRVMDPQRYLISGVHLSGNPSLSQPPENVLNAFAEVVETVSGSFGSLELRTQSDLNGPSVPAWIDPLPWPVETLHVSKDIQLFSSIENDIATRATISQIDQTFSQIPVEVPEPMGILLSGFAALVTLSSRRCFRK